VSAAPESLAVLVEALRKFLIPILGAAHDARADAMRWTADDEWFVEPCPAGEPGPRP
jgi:hypothetical protein